MADALERIRSLAKPPRVGNARWLRRLMGRQKGQCTWCGGLVPRGRRSWCSDRCVESFRRQCDPQWTARRIGWWLAGGRWRRLHCEGCGRDVMARTSAIAWLTRRSRAAQDNGRAIGPNHRVNLIDRSGVRRIARGQWELDHILPVAEGGGCCGPEGLRVLCVTCHARETAALRARLSGRK
jgi:hypothetical protein